MVASSSTAAGQPPLIRVSPTMLGLWVFIAAEALFFGILIASYLYLRVRAGVWPPPDMPQRDLTVPVLNSIVLLSSALTMHGAHLSMRRGDTRMLQAGIFATVLLGSAFLAGQAYEYANAGFGLGNGLLGSGFFTLTGFHGAHVLAGLVLLAMVVTRATQGHYSAERHLGVEAGSLYWHFVDAVWIVLFTVIYIV